MYAKMDTVQSPVSVARYVLCTSMVTRIVKGESVLAGIEGHPPQGLGTHDYPGAHSFSLSGDDVFCITRC